MNLKGAFERLSEHLLLHLARTNTLLMLAIIGLITGLASGGVIVVFRLLVENIQLWFHRGASPEDYEILGPWVRLTLPVIAGLLIGLIFHRFAGGNHLMGVARVMERLAYHQGYLQARGFFLQFFGAALAIIGGHSVGREGPNIYLGAAAGSLLGQRLKLPNNSIRTMVGCGVAAGIAASFNTPLAGVIFALEVVMMEYTIASFTPIILAAVSANALSIAVFGSDPAFTVPPFELGSLGELPLILLLALASGAVSAGFVELLQRTASYSRDIVFWKKATIAGLITGLCGLAVPEVMGIGYDTVTRALSGELAIGLLIAMILLKLVATSACVGLGIPGGMIGPALFIGAALGSLFGIVGHQFFPGQVSDVGFYALLGLGALMGASLQAPLSALTAMIELTHNPEVVMPGMLVIVIAGLTAGELFGKESLFISLLKANGLDYATGPVMQTLRRMSVAGVMTENFQRMDRMVNLERMQQLLERKPEWIVVNEEDGRMSLMPTIDLLTYLQEQPAETAESLDLISIPARRRQLGSIHLQATLQEAWERLDKGDVEALYVERMNAPGIRRIYGVLTREQVESAYRY